MTAAKNGKSVALVDRRSDIGGGCVHWGTIPSKMLRRTVQQYTNFRNSELFGPALKDYPIEYQDLIKQAESVTAKQMRMRTRFYDRNDVDVYDGHGKFVDEHTVEVTGAGLSKRVQADHFIIAVGTRPYRPDDIDFSHERVRDSDTILTMTETPGTITIYGAGVIGCEYASIFRNLDCKVNLLNTRDKLLEFLDDEIIDALAYHLREQGALIRHNEVYDRVVTSEDRVELHMKSGKIIKSDVLLWAQGRSGQTDGLGLEHVGIEPNKRKQLDVNESYQTSVPNIYAVGDVIGQPGLASASYDQGRFAATHIVFGSCDKRLVEHIPTGIYTSPEISSVGPTERELTEQCVPYEVGHALFKSLARAQIVDRRVGMLKVLFHRETFEILGIHCFGYQAAEIVHIGQAIMAQKGAGNDVRYFANTTFNYPTMAEAYRVAALNGLNRLR